MICFSIVSCIDFDQTNPAHELQRNQYEEVEANLDLTCKPIDSIDTYIKAQLDGGAEVCYYKGVDNLIPWLGRSTGYTTPSPSTSCTTWPAGLVSRAYKQ